MSTSCTCHHKDFNTYDEQHDWHKPLWEANPKQYGMLTPEDKILLQRSNDSQVLAENARTFGLRPIPPVGTRTNETIHNVVTEPKLFDKSVGKYKVRIVQDGK